MALPELGRGITTWAIAITFFTRFYARKSMKKNSTFVSGTGMTRPACRTSPAALVPRNQPMQKIKLPVQCCVNGHGETACRAAAP